MVDQLSAFADEVTRVAREVGTEGQLGGQAEVPGVSGTWEDLTDNVNSMARNLTDQVRNISTVATAVANGDLTQRITVDAQGEILELKTTLNTMVDQLSAFADEVTRVAREVGTEGKLGGQAEVPGVSGTWEDLTDNVNQLAANLTTQVRAIAEVSTAVTRGDLSQRIAVEALGEVAELKDTINQMIVNLSETTEQNTAQDWLKTNVARISTMLQGQRDVTAVANQIMSHVTPARGGAQRRVLLRGAEEGAPASPRRSCGSSPATPTRIATPLEPLPVGEGLVGQAAVERTPIVVTGAPEDYVIRSGLGEAAAVHVLVLPVIFEGQLMGVLEFASLQTFSPTSRQLLDELVETLGIVLHTIEATMRTEELLEQSQSLTQELQAQSEELQAQQEELQQTNEELEDKAELLETQKRAIELTNAEIERARTEVEERAEQLALSSSYKSEFLANMSHELRTPLNSMLILSRLLADEGESLTDEQREFAETINRAGNDLLDLINDILDLSKIEAGRHGRRTCDGLPRGGIEPVGRGWRQIAADKGLPLHVNLGDAPGELYTDVRRLHQILKNLLANAIKFTEEGEVRVSRSPARSIRRRSPNGSAPTSSSPSTSATPASASVTSSGRSSSRPSSRATDRGADATAGPASGCRSAASSPPCSEARSPSTAPRARGPPSASTSPSTTCRSRTIPRRDPTSPNRSSGSPPSRWTTPNFRSPPPHPQRRPPRGRRHRPPPSPTTGTRSGREIRASSRW
jgi:signal transduction histidine kinase/HAMP domain-containing protein